MPKLLLLNGPNLNLLGSREPEVYGTSRLADIEARARRIAEEQGALLDSLQSNAEHLLIERIQAAGRDGTDFIVFNPGAFTHTSIALRDALLAVGVPFIELHLSNPQAREAFRRKSYFSDIASACLCGFGARGYEMAIRAAIDWLAAED